MIKILLKFGLVGVMNTLIDYTLFQLIVYLLHISQRNSIEIFLANVTSASIALTNSFIFNKRWTFQDTRKDFWPQFLRFTIINVVGILVVNTGTLLLLDRILPLYFTILHISIKTIFVTKVGAIGFTMVFNFLAYRKWVFTGKPNEEIEFPMSA